MWSGTSKRRRQINKRRRGMWSMSEVEKQKRDEDEEETPVEVARRLREKNREIYDKLADE